MSDLEWLRDIQVFALDLKSHDRAAFESGVAAIDNFLKLTAKRQQKDNTTRAFVAVEPSTTRVIGYYAINTHSVRAEDLPPEWSKRAPRHGGIPAAFLSNIGVDRNFQGRGLGNLLLIDALDRIELLSDQIGLSIVVLDVLTDGDAETIRRRSDLYRRVGFTPFPANPLRMLLSIQTWQAAKSRI